MQKHVNIPIFIPEQACPHQCVFCNQRNISGQKHIPTKQEILTTIDDHLSTCKLGDIVQVAFFGGSFTGIPLNEQEAYLSLVAPYIAQGKIQSIRLSTRPDYINIPVLELLKKYKVGAIELGAQSFNDEVLRRSGRGHTRADIVRAAKLITEFGFELGLQMMIGLPGDTPQLSVETAQHIVALGAKTTRIYPTLVIADTPLETLYRDGQYKVLSLDEAIVWTKQVMKIFLHSDTRMLRVGLHQSEELNMGGKLLAGPYHTSFKELVLTEIWYDIFMNSLPREKGKLHIEVPPAAINFAVGYKGKNKTRLKNIFGWIKITASAKLKDFEYTYSYC